MSFVCRRTHHTGTALRYRAEATGDEVRGCAQGLTRSQAAPRCAHSEAVTRRGEVLAGRGGQMRVFYAKNKRILKTEDSLAERNEFELSVATTGYRFAVTRWRSEVNSNCRYRFVNSQTTASG